MTLNGQNKTPVLNLGSVSLKIKGKQILDSISLEVHSGELIGLVGPNGSGKSSLLKIASGVLDGASGTVLIEGYDLNKLKQRNIANLASYMPQVPNPSSFTSGEVVAMGNYKSTSRFSWDMNGGWRKVLTAMARTQTRRFRERVYDTLSGGEQRRVILARSLVQSTPLLLLDEPTAGMDIKYSERTMRMAQTNAAKGTAVVVALHDLNLALRYCNRLAVLSEGRLVALGTPNEILQSGVLERVFEVKFRLIDADRPYIVAD